MRSEDHITSWTGRIKEELMEIFEKTPKCQEAELSAIMLLNPQCVSRDSISGKYIYEEPSYSSKNHFTDKRKTYNIENGADFTKDPEAVYTDVPGKRAFLRGAFLASGIMTDPNKSYQLEISTLYEWQALKLQNLMAYFGISSRTVSRRGRCVVYIKEGPSIVDMLNVIGAHKALMEFENVRILKEMRGSINRQVNCETANIKKNVNASMKQIEDIELIRDEMGFDLLSENLRQICMARLDNPDATLSELGELMRPPLGKSGVNHRLRKLSSIADEIRGKKEKGII